MSTNNDFQITLDTAREALSHIPADERATWVKMGLSLYDQFGEAAFDAWDEWSQRAESYKTKDAKTVWKSLSRMGGGGRHTTIASLLWEAKNYGFRLRKDQQAKYTSEQIAQMGRERDARREAQRIETERAERKAAATAAEIWGTASDASADHPYLKRKGIQAHGLKWVDTWSKDFVDHETGEVKTVSVANALVLPIWSAPGRISSLQAIFASDKNRLKRDKDYLSDGKKQGGYFFIGSISADTHTVLVCEGFATGATLHEATDYPVMVAFDAGNLQPVAESLRAKLPGCGIVVCADNDAFTARANGEAYNPGVEAATKAAEAVRGILCVPVFTALDGKPTDFNDLAKMAGLEAVASQIERALNPPAPAPAPEPAPWDDDGDGTAPPAAESPPPPPTESELDRNGYFTVLGYEHRRHYIFAHGKRQILDYGVGDFSDAGLIELAPLNWWEMNFPGPKDGIDKKAVAEFMIRTAERRGIYDISRLRGRGAWVDDKRMVYHHGGYLTIDGVTTQVTDIRSRYVYELHKSLPTDPADTPMSSEEGEMLIELAKLFRWTKPGSAALLAGWVALAPICGALKWRPHIWLTGGAGCGKSTVLNDFCNHLMGENAVFAQGNSSEAGIRQTLKADALPVLYDESEQNDEREKMRVQNIISLIRQASTDSQAQTLKGTAGGDAMSFHIRSMFCLASIQVGLRHQADVERLAVLSLKPKREETNAGEAWGRIQESLECMKADTKLPAKLMRRSLDLLPVILENIKVFARVAARSFGSQRDGDQYGTLLAGCWCLMSTQVATEDQALQMINDYDWSEHLESTDSDESEKALAALLECPIRMQGGNSVTVYELTRAACGMVNSGLSEISEAAADATLQRHGMKVWRRTGDNRLIISNSSLELRRLLEGSPYEADLRGLLLRLPGSDRCVNKPQRFNGVPSKCISISLADIVEGVASGGGEADAF